MCISDCNSDVCSSDLLISKNEKMRKIIYLFLTGLLTTGTTSCSQDDILNERPKDFLTPSNSYNTPDAFVSAIANIYLDVREQLYEGGWQTYQMLGPGVDVAAVR